MKRKILANVLTLCMLFSMIPMTAFAADTDPVVYAGLSADAETMVRDIDKASGMTATVDEDASNLLWFAMNNLTASTTYTLSMKNSNGVEVLNDNSIAYDNGSQEFETGSTSTKHLIYVSLDEFSADGKTGQGNNAALGNGGKFTVTITKSGESTATATTTIELEKANDKWVQVVPAVWAGLSVDNKDLVADIKAITGMNAGEPASTETAKNLLWFAMKGLDAGKYTLSMKSTGAGGQEVLNKNSIAYDSQDGKFDVAAAGKHLIYVSLDEFSADGKTGQGSLTALGNGGTFNVSVTKDGEDNATATSTIELVKITLDTGENVTLPTGTKTDLYAVKGDKVTLPEATKTGQEFKGWAVSTETPVKGEYTASTSVTLKPVFGAPVVKTPELSRAGFDMDATKACAAINEALKAVRPSGSVPGADVDTNTMFVAANNLDSTKTYELAVTKGSTSIYTEELTGKTETVFYFTFNPKGGSHTKEAISTGEYNFALNEVSGDTKTPVGNTVSLELVKATLKAEDASSTFTPVDLYAAKGGKVTIPSVVPTRTGYTFVGWNDRTQTVVEDDELTLTASVELTPVWQNSKVETTTTAPVVNPDLSSEIKTALTDTASSSTANPAELMKDAALAKETDTIAKEATVPNTPEFSGYTDVKVVVFLQVDVADYTPAAGGEPATMELNITPMYQLVATKGSSDTKNIGEAQELTTTEFTETATINVKLPAGFATASDTVIAKHWNDAKTSVIEWLRTTTVDSNVNVTFKPNSFSPYELTVDNRTVTVSYTAGDGATMPTDPVPQSVFKPSDIGYTLPVPTKDNATFDGWSMAGSNTEYKTLTEELFDALVNVGGTVVLTANFSTSGGNNSTTGGGGVSSNVTIDRPTNGKVTVTPTAPSKGATVTINLTPDTGYAVGTVTVTDKDGKAVELTKVDDTHYTFVMPDGKVTVKATFTATATTPDGFTDVPADAYYADAVKWAVDKGITNGLTATTFGPNNSCTRGQMVTFLWRAAGSPAATGTNSFTDVASGEYYYNAVLWAVEKGITNGTTATTFSPNATVNRGQTVTFLYRYAESPAATGTSSFTDVAADAYYADAVKWAVAEGITNGTSDTTFAPASNCTRGQIVTFLYRQMAE